METSWATDRDSSSATAVAGLRGIYEIRESIAKRQGHDHVAAMCRSLLDALHDVVDTHVILTVEKIPRGIITTITDPDSGQHVYSFCFVPALLSSQDDLEK